MGRKRSRRKQPNDDGINARLSGEPDETPDDELGPDLSRDGLLDVFLLDDQDEPQPEYGDFWFEPDDEEG